VVGTAIPEPVVKTERLPDTEIWRQMTITLYIGHSIPQLTWGDRLSVQQNSPTLFATV